MSVSEKLSRSERIRSDRRIDALFKEGRWGSAGTLKYCFRTEAAAISADGNWRVSVSAVSILVSVPKKSFKRAWKRNLIKRRIKESYRRRKQPLTEKSAAAGKHIDIAFICAPVVEKDTPRSAIEIPDFKTIDDAIAKILEQILERS